MDAVLPVKYSTTVPNLTFDLDNQASRMYQRPLLRIIYFEFGDDASTFLVSDSYKKAN